MTHTYALLEVSPAVYGEVAEKLRSAGYTHAFLCHLDHGPVIDMHGIALQAKADPPFEPVHRAEHHLTYHVGGIVCDEGENAGVLAVTSNTDPSPDFPASVRIVVGSPPQSPLMEGPIPRINGWAMSVETAKEFVATIQQAIRDVETGEVNDRDLLTIAEDGGAPISEAMQRDMARIYGCSLAWLQGAAPQVPESFREMLRRSNVSEHDQAELLQFAGMLSLMPPKPSAADRLAVVAKKHDPMPPRAAKARYVKRQRQTRDHGCHWPGCDQQVPPAMWGCKAHWFRLPKPLRDRIWNAYRPGQEATMTPSTEYLQVADDVQRWIRENTTAPEPRRMKGRR